MLYNLAIKNPSCTVHARRMKWRPLNTDMSTLLYSILLRRNTNTRTIDKRTEKATTPQKA